MLEVFSQFSYSTLSSEPSWYTCTTELVSFYALASPPLVGYYCLLLDAYEPGKGTRALSIFWSILSLRQAPSAFVLSMGLSQ